jgi:hypothetical protein
MSSNAATPSPTALPVGAGNCRRCSVAVANALLLVSPNNSWDAIGEAIKAANANDKFTGEDGELTLTFSSKGSSSVWQNSVADFDVAGKFDHLAKEDYEKSIDLARGFQREAPRANAVIAIARAILEDKKK